MLMKVLRPCSADEQSYRSSTLDARPVKAEQLLVTDVSR